MRRLLLLLLFCISSFARSDEFLDPNLAFKPSTRVVDAKTIEVSFDIAKGYYLYRKKFAFSSDNPDDHLGVPAFPKGKIKNDDFFGDVEVFYNRVSVRLPIERAADKTTAIPLKVIAQGCADAGFCYPPQTYVLNVLPGANPQAGSGEALNTDESGIIAQTLKQSGLFASLIFFFLAGLGLSLTPCVFPMIPILSGIIAGQGDRVSRSRGFSLSLAYVLGMSLTYSAAGVVAGMTGTLISNALQNTWVLGGFALVFVALSLSMFGLYNLQLPNFMQSKLSDKAGNFRGGSGLGIFLMGALSALIVGPCVAAPLAGALLYIGQTGNAFLGGAALFAMALGMGVPLLVVGLSAGTLLPKAGLWMDNVKKFFGVLLLGTAVWLVSPVIPAMAQMLAWAALLIIPATFLHATDPLTPGAKGWQRFWKGCGIVMLISGTAIWVGALSGSRDVFQPLAGLQAHLQEPVDKSSRPSFERVVSVEELESKIKQANRPVMLDFYADWCVSCKEMERDTFRNPDIQKELSAFKLLQVDVTENTPSDKVLLARFGLFGPPGIIFFDAAGKEVKSRRVVGFQAPSDFIKALKGGV